MAGAALGTFVGGPIGTSIGSSLGSMAGNALGLELEGVTQEDREFETARQFVKFAGETVKNALQAPPNSDPAVVANIAAAEAARDHAPGLMDADAGRSGPHDYTTTIATMGHWVRHGEQDCFVRTLTPTPKGHSHHA